MAEKGKNEYSAFENLKKKVFDEAERLLEDSTFKFGCHPGVPCFNKCCTDVNIFLTPYDIIRAKNRLGIDSEEFLARYTIMPMDDKQAFPVVMLAMTDDERKACYFVDDEKGCTIYEDRPWPCRIFPIGKASPKDKMARPFYFQMKEDVCQGWQEETEWTIAEWLEDQKVKEYDEMGEMFKDLTLHDFFGKGGKLSPPQMEMFHMVCYNIDKFRIFVFESSFLKRFDVEEERIEKMKTDDVELMRFGFDWLRFLIFQETRLKISDQERDAAKMRNQAKETE